MAGAKPKTLSCDPSQISCRIHMIAQSPASLPEHQQGSAPAVDASNGEALFHQKKKEKKKKRRRNGICSVVDNLAAKCLCGFALVSLLPLFVGVWRAGCVRGSPPQCCNSGFLFNTGPSKCIFRSRRAKWAPILSGCLPPEDDWRTGDYPRRMGRGGGSRNKCPAGGEDVSWWKVLECVMACPWMKSQRKPMLNPSRPPANAAVLDVAGSRTMALAL